MKKYGNTDIAADRFVFVEKGEVMVPFSVVQLVKKMRSLGYVSSDINKLLLVNFHAEDARNMKINVSNEFDQISHLIGDNLRLPSGDKVCLTGPTMTIDLYWKKTRGIANITSRLRIYQDDNGKIYSARIIFADINKRPDIVWPGLSEDDDPISARNEVIFLLRDDLTPIVTVEDFFKERSSISDDFFVTDIIFKKVYTYGFGVENSWSSIPAFHYTNDGQSVDARKTIGLIGQSGYIRLLSQSVSHLNFRGKKIPLSLFEKKLLALFKAPLFFDIFFKQLLKKLNSASFKKLFILETEACGDNYYPVANSVVNQASEYVSLTKRSGRKVS